MTFKDALSRVERSERVTSELEAKKLGFFLFHNIKSDFNRWASARPGESGPAAAPRVLTLLCSGQASAAARRQRASLPSRQMCFVYSACSCKRDLMEAPASIRQPSFR